MSSAFDQFGDTLSARILTPASVGMTLNLDTSMKYASYPHSIYLCAGIPVFEVVSAMLCIYIYFCPAIPVFDVASIMLYLLLSWHSYR